MVSGNDDFVATGELGAVVRKLTRFASDASGQASSPSAAFAPCLRVKHAFDRTAAVVLLATALPLLVSLAVMIRLTSRGPALFCQRRVGENGIEFRMYKLRTMVRDAERNQDRLAEAQRGRTFLKIVRDPRVTRLGRLLRKTSLDELPQLLNVVKGEMSLVGPRPLLPCDVLKLSEAHRLRRFRMKPGMSGLWQVSGRSSLSEGERIRLDLWYVDHWSLALDAAILVRTLPAVLTGRGAT